MLTETPIELAGRHLFLRYSTRDLLRAEAALGKPIVATLQKGEELSLQDMSTLIKYGLKTQDMKQISEEQYEDILDQMAPVDFITTAAKALNLAFSSTKKEENTGKN